MSKVTKINTIEEFFRDMLNEDWKPLPPHEIYQSPCYPIIGIKIYKWINDKTGVKDTSRWYYCKVHPKVENIYLGTIEHHCKYKEPEKHKSKVLEFLQLLLQQNRLRI
ncbi:MAG: hypothetical protein WA941_16680 [Nitrososphaeraceae archaeon]